MVTHRAWQALPPDIWEDIAIFLSPALEDVEAPWGEPLSYVPCATFGQLSACCREIQEAMRSEMQHCKEKWLSTRPGPSDRLSSTETDTEVLEGIESTRDRIARHAANQWFRHLGSPTSD